MEGIENVEGEQTGEGKEERRRRKKKEKKFREK